MCKLSFTLIIFAEGIVEILTWKLDLKSQEEIRTEGIFASLNDCLYRNMYKLDYLIFMDLDEYIIPHIKINKTNNSNNKGKNTDSNNNSAITLQEMINYLVLFSAIKKF